VDDRERGEALRPELGERVAGDLALDEAQAVERDHEVFDGGGGHGDLGCCMYLHSASNYQCSERSARGGMDVRSRADRPAEKSSTPSDESCGGPRS
jgi:hypothetical protein